MKPAGSVVLALLLAFVLGGCASSTPARLDYGISAIDDGHRRMWPPAPEVPRYQYAGQLTGETNFVYDDDQTSAIGNFLRWVVGLGDEPASRVLQRPQAIAGDNRGRIFVTDVSRGAVFVFDETAGELKIWEYAVGLRRFVSPIGVISLPDGGIWVADADLGVIARLDDNGRGQPPIGQGVLVRPTGLAHDAASGEVYVADTYAHCVRVFSPQGALLRTIGQRGEAPGEFNFPTHLAFADGHLYVTDTMNNRIQVLDPQGHAPPRVIGRRGLNFGDLVRPKGVAVDSEHNVYVIESYYDNLLIYNAAGEFLMPIGGVGQTEGKFYLPAGVWVDRFDRVFVADTFNGRVAVFRYLGGADADES